MMSLSALGGAPGAEHLALALLHSLWQGALAAALLWCLLRPAGDHPRLRYALSLLVLGSLVLTVFATFAVLERSRPESDGAVVRAPSVRGPVSASTPPGNSGRPIAPEAGPVSTERSTRWPVLVLVIWCVGAACMLLRTVVLLGDAQRLRRRCTRVTDADLELHLDRMRHDLGIARRVLLGFSSRVVIPCTVGLIRPLIILPPNLADLDAADLEAVLLHELAHIRRLDWLVNIAQMLIESLLFFNPALWWISRQVRIEREAACDYAVVARTRRPTRYAELLVRVASESPEDRRRVALAAGSAGNLSERIRRLVVPGYRATAHPGILPVLLTLGALALCGLGTYRTTAATLRYFGRRLSPQERAVALAALETEYGQDETGDHQLPESEWIHVRGRVVTADGSPLPKRRGRYAAADLLSCTPGSTSSQSLTADGHFDFRVGQARLTLSVVCPGYAPRHVEMDCEPGQRVDDLTLTLERGYPAAILCVDPNGLPIPGARLVGGFPSPPEYGSYSHSLHLTTDSEGLAEFENLSGDAPLSLTCQAPGFAKARRERFRLMPQQVLTWTLRPVPPATIQVGEALTGRPLAGAGIHVQGPLFWGDFDAGQPPETLTDDAGRALLDSLVPGESYLVMIRSAGRQPHYATVTAGQSVAARLVPFRPIRGRITGDLRRLSRDDDGPLVTRTNVYRVGDSRHSSTCGKHRVPVTVVSEGEAVFQVDDYYGQQVHLRTGDTEVTVDVAGGDDLNDVCIHLGPPAPSDVSFATLRFRFESLGDVAPSAAGTFQLNYCEPGSRYTRPHAIAFDARGVEVAVPWPNSLSWEPEPNSPVYFKQGHREIQDGGPVTITVPCYAAGSIVGAVAVPASHRYRYAYLRLEFLNRSQLFQRTGFLPHNDLNLQSIDPLTKFHFGPLPLGGRYALIFTSQNTVLHSEPINLTAERPLCEVSLPWPERLVTLHGRLLDAQGAPAAGVTYHLGAAVASHAHGFSDAQTDAAGRFTCEAVNPDSAIRYSLEVRSDTAPWTVFPLPARPEPVTLRLPRGLPFSGVVRDHAGKLQPHVTLSVTPKTRGGGSQRIQTDAQGRFRAVLADTEYTVYTRRRLPREDGRRSWTTQSLTFHPARDPNLTIISDALDD